MCFNLSGEALTFTRSAEGNELSGTGKVLALPITPRWTASRRDG